MAYKKHTWASQEVITTDKMNNIETGIDEAVNKTTATPARGSAILIASADVKNGGKILNADFKKPDNITPAVGDVVYDTNGDTYYVTAVDNAGITIGGALPINVKGVAGTQGTDGKSAFQVWQSQTGNAGKTEAQFLEAIKGPKGEQGDPAPRGTDGKAGAAGTNGTDGTNGKSVAGMEFTFTKDTTTGAITTITGKYKLDGEATAAHDITCTIK